jgi:hypothetical protein
MALVRPRLTDHYGLSLAQAEVDFAIPFLDEDLPLYVDPFLLWRSPSQQDNALHTALLISFNHQGGLASSGKEELAVQNLITASECDEVGLGVSANRKGKRIGSATALEVLRLFRQLEAYNQRGFTHIEEIQLFVDGISRDRISDIACSFLKSFLVDYTIEHCIKLEIPRIKLRLPALYEYREQRFVSNAIVELPLNPLTGGPILFVPKRWLRHIPWINFDDYFSSACPKDDVVNAQGSDERVQVLLYNRANYGVVESYIRAKERTAEDCRSDPLFTQIPVISARRKLREIKRLPTGTDDRAYAKYEAASAQLLASLLYPQLDFAAMQVRSDSGVTIRDLIFYNNRTVDFLQEILSDYNSRQLVIEMKNVQEIGSEHINQLNRYLSNEFGGFGVLLTRNNLTRAMLRNTIDLWSGQRRCIIALTDADLELMVEVFDSKQRMPIDVLKRAYVEFRRACPS